MSSPVPRLSVLVCGVPSRLASGPPCLLSLLRQAEGKPVEVLYLLDNKRRTIGAKRQALLAIARGDYVSYVDDDDAVAPDYVDRLLGAIVDVEVSPDVVVFPVKVTLNGGSEGVVEASAREPVLEPYRPGGITRRRPIQIACWRRELVVDVPFPDANAGEDDGWGDVASARVVREVRVDAVLYHYRWSAAGTEGVGGIGRRG